MEQDTVITTSLEGFLKPLSVLTTLASSSGPRFITGFCLLLFASRAASHGQYVDWRTSTFPKQAIQTFKSITITGYYIT